MLAGILLIVNGLTYMDSFTILGIISIIIGFLLFGYLIWNRLKKVGMHLFEPYIYFAQAIGLLMTSHIYNQSGMKYLQYVILFAAVASLFAAFYTIFKSRKTNFSAK